jgi:hypothetical protein
MGGIGSTGGEMINAYNILVGKLEGKRPLRRPRRKCGMNPREVMWEDVDWMHLAQDRDQWRALVNAVTKLQVP